MGSKELKLYMRQSKVSVKVYRRVLAAYERRHPGRRQRAADQFWSSCPHSRGPMGPSPPGNHRTSPGRCTDVCSLYRRHHRCNTTRSIRQRQKVRQPRTSVASWMSRPAEVCSGRCISSTVRSPYCVKSTDLLVSPIAISSHDYRPRLDLQALERCLVSVGWPFWLNSARGGFHHVPDKSTFPAPNPITTLPTNVSSAQLNHQVEKLVRCPYEIWCKVSKSSPSFHPSAIDTAVEHIMIRRSWHSVPYALWLDVPKDITPQ